MVDSRFCHITAELSSEAYNHGISAANWAYYKWDVKWKSDTTRLRSYIPNTGSHVIGASLPRQAWVRLNRLRTGVGLFKSTLHKWGVANSPFCECGAEEQTADHIIKDCTINRPPNGEEGLRDLDDETVKWLLNTDLAV